jgi:hypothetical protein
MELFTLALDVYDRLKSKVDLTFTAYFSNIAKINTILTLCTLMVILTTSTVSEQLCSRGPIDPKVPRTTEFTTIEQVALSELPNPRI